MKVTLIGPMPPPMNGCSYANHVFCSNSGGGVEIGVIDTSTPGISGDQGARFSIRKAVFFLAVYLQLPKVIRSDVIYLTPGQTLFGVLKYSPFMLMAMLWRKPYVIHLHGNHLGAYYSQLRGWRKSLLAFFLGKADGGIVLSESLRSNFAELLSAERVFVVENFAADEVLHFVDKPVDLPRIVYLSNLMLEKGIFVLFDALQRLKERGVPFEAVIAGTIETGLEKAVRERISGLGCSVRYVGQVSGEQKLRILQAANIFVLPTYYPMEGQPISLIEGLATGNIIVTTAHAGIPDIVSEANGYLVPIKDDEAIADAVYDVSIDVRGKVARFAEHNAAYAASRFSEKRFYNQIVEVLRHCTYPRAAQTRARGDS